MKEETYKLREEKGESEELRKTEGKVYK